MPRPSPLRQQIHPEHLIERQLAVFLVGQRFEPRLHAHRIGVKLGAALFVAELERTMRTPEGPALWYLSAINRLAQADADIRTVSIEGLQWGELDFPDDLIHVRSLAANWL